MDTFYIITFYNFLLVSNELVHLNKLKETDNLIRVLCWRAKIKKLIIPLPPYALKKEHQPILRLIKTLIIPIKQFFCCF